MNLLSLYLNPYLLVHYYDLKSILKNTLILGFSIKLKSIKILGGRSSSMDLNIFFGFKKEPRKGNFGDTAPPNHCFLIKNYIHDLNIAKNPPARTNNLT